MALNLATKSSLDCPWNLFHFYFSAEGVIDRVLTDFMGKARQAGPSKDGGKKKPILPKGIGSPADQNLSAGQHLSMRRCIVHPSTAGSVIAAITDAEAPSRR